MVVVDRRRLSLPTLLSHALVAMTIGLDNELEQRTPHTTTLGLKRGLPAEGPWLVSWSSWANLLRFVPPEGISLQDLRAYAGVSERHLSGKNPGIIRWRYATLSGVGGGFVRPTANLREASETVFPYLPGVVEAKWADQLGAGAVGQLKEVLGELLSRVDQRLPHYLPQADNLMWTRWGPTAPREEAIDDLALVDRLAQVLLLYTLEHESASEVPLTMAANLVRVIDDEGARTADLVRRSGISKEAMAFLTGWRQRPRLSVESAPRTLTLTAAGRIAKTEYETLARTIEQSWATRFPGDVAARLRSALEQVVVDATLARSPLAQLVKAPEGCWRSWVKSPETLPHFPMILHRGGYPDGA
jgi:hypothetical protein